MRGRNNQERGRRAAPRASRPLTPAELYARARSAGSAKEILDLLRSVEPSCRQGPGLDSLTRTLLGSARRFNETLGDVESAIALWKETYRLGTEDTRQRVVATMMSVARKRLDVSLPKESRTMSASVAIYEAVYGLDFSADQNIRVVKTMMDVANRFTDLRGPLSDMDVDSAMP